MNNDLGFLLLLLLFNSIVFTQIENSKKLIDLI